MKEEREGRVWVICLNPRCTKGEDGGPAEFTTYPKIKAKGGGRYCSMACKNEFIHHAVQDAVETEEGKKEERR